MHSYTVIHYATASLSETKVCGNVSHRPASCFASTYPGAASGQAFSGRLILITLRLHACA